MNLQGSANILELSFLEVGVVPKNLIGPFSRLASSMDCWLQVNLPVAMKKFGFNIVAIGRFPK
jgi:hypothetical protein